MGIHRPADEVIVKYGTKVIWKCHVCGHEWKNDVYDRTRAPKPSGCVKCQRRTASGRFRQMAIEKTGALADTNPNLAAAWDYEKNGNLTPSDIAANSNGTYWFLCRSCGASYKSYPGAKEPLCMGCMRKVRGRKSGKKVVCVETGTVYETIRDAGIQGRPLYDGLRLHGLGDRYEQHLLRHRDHRSSSER